MKYRHVNGWQCKSSILNWHIRCIDKGYLIKVHCCSLKIKLKTPTFWEESWSAKSFRFWKFCIDFVTEGSLKQTNTQTNKQTPQQTNKHTNKQTSKNPEAELQLTCLFWQNFNIEVNGAFASVYLYNCAQLAKSNKKLKSIVLKGG